MSTSPTAGASGWFEEQAAQYRDGEQRPLAGYLALMSVYAGGTAAAAATAKAMGRQAPERISPWDLAQLAVATQRVARLVTKDPVTSPFRAPFTRYEGLSAPGELAEEVRGHGLRHSVGELLTCPMCLSQWVATGFTLGLVLAPRVTRMIMGTFAAVGAADFLQHAYVRLQQATE